MSDLDFESVLKRCPVGWAITSFAELFKEGTERNSPELPLLAVTGKAGVIPRNQLEKRDTSPEDKSKYKVLHNDNIAYNTMRLWQGVLGYSKLEGIISPAYTILISNEGVYSKFFSYVMKTPWMINAFFRHSQGLCDDTSNCKYNHLKTVKALIPPFSEQRKIAVILSSVDRCVESIEALIAKLQDLKKALMQELLTKGLPSEVAAKYGIKKSGKFKDSPLGKIPEEWEVVRLSDCCDILDEQRIPIKKEDRAGMQGSIPYYGASGIIDWVNEFIFEDELILVGEDGANLISRSQPLAFRVSGKCWVNNHAHVLRAKSCGNVNYLTLYMENINYIPYITGSAQPKLNQDMLAGIPVKLPSLIEQARLSEGIAGPENKMSIAKKNLRSLQYLKKALMQDLLTGKVRVKVDGVA